MKAVDFEQTWSQGGPLEVGFLADQPTATTTNVSFLHSEEIVVPNYDGAPFNDGFTDVDQNVRYFITFQTTSAITDPWFTVRKSENGDRFAIDDIEITLLPPDTGSGSTAYDYWAALNDLNSLPTEDEDGDGEANFIEFVLATDPQDPRSQTTFSLDQNGSALTLSYQQTLASLQDYEVTLLWSRNLNDWNDTGLSIEQIAENETTRTLEAVIDSTNEPRLFFQLLVEDK